MTAERDIPLKVTCPICEEITTSSPEGEVLLALHLTKQVLKCPDCQSSFLYPIPISAELRQVYQPDYFRGFFKSYWKDYYKGIQLGKRLTKIKPGGNFLDIGCAIGSMLAGIRDTTNWQVYGIEADEKTAEYARTKRGLKVFDDNLEQLQFEAGFFDYIYANNVIEHIPQPANFFKAANRLLAKAGILHLSTPNGPIDLYPSLKLGNPENPVLTRHAGHVNFFSQKGLFILAEKVGFQVVRFRTFHFKTALKCKLIWPGSRRKLAQSLAGEKETIRSDSQKANFEDYEKLIPVRPPNWYLGFRNWSRQLFKAFLVPVGADFEVILKKGE